MFDRGDVFDGGEEEEPLDPAVELRRDVERALENPIRRRILRMLIDSDEPRTSPELFAGSGAETASQLAYHVAVLARVGAIRRRARSLTASPLATDPFISIMLGLTREEDELGSSPP